MHQLHEVKQYALLEDKFSLAELYSHHLEIERTCIRLPIYRSKRYYYARHNLSTLVGQMRFVREPWPSER